MDILEHAIHTEGGVGKLAGALGEKQNTVSNWRKRGLPRSWASVLRLKYPTEKQTHECVLPPSVG